MLKNVQLKIILIFSILGIVLMSGIGVIYAYNLQNVNFSLVAQTEEQVMAYQELIKMQIQNVKVITIILITVYGFISILIGIFVSKVILDPISRLIDSAPKMANGENSNTENSKKNVD